MSLFCTLQLNKRSSTADTQTKGATQCDSPVGLFMIFFFQRPPRCYYSPSDWSAHKIARPRTLLPGWHFLRSCLLWIRSSEPTWLGLPEPYLSTSLASGHLDPWEWTLTESMLTDAGCKLSGICCIWSAVRWYISFEKASDLEVFVQLLCYVWRWCLCCIGGVVFIEQVKVWNPSRFSKQIKTVQTFAKNRHLCLHRLSPLPYCCSARSRQERAPARGLPDITGRRMEPRVRRRNTLIDQDFLQTREKCFVATRCCD